MSTEPPDVPLSEQLHQLAARLHDLAEDVEHMETLVGDLQYNLAEQAKLVAGRHRERERKHKQGELLP